MNRKQKSFHRRAKLLVDFMERNDLEMEDLERGAIALQEIRRERKMPISTQPVKLEDIGAAVMPFSTHFSSGITEPIKAEDIGAAAQPFFHRWHGDFPPYACTHDSNFRGLGKLTASKFRDLEG